MTADELVARVTPENRYHRYRARHRERLRARDREYARGRKKVRDPQKERARAMVRGGVRFGWIIKPAQCPRCGMTAVLQAHHEDYSKPLER